MMQLVKKKNSSFLEEYHPTSPGMDMNGGFMWIPPVFFTAPGVVGSPKSKGMLVSPRSEEALQ